MTPMTPLGRTLAALSFREGDRPPVFLLFTTHGAREAGLPLSQYFSDARAVVEAQLKLRARFGHDCLYSFHYASLELEAWGGVTDFTDLGPPTAGAPVFRRPDDVLRVDAPPALTHPALQRVLTVTASLRAESRGEVPIIGVAIAPFSLPAMQLGLGPWFELLVAAQTDPRRRAQLEHLLALNEAFTTAWARAQLAAGATAVVYFDPLSSSTMTPPELGVDVGFAIARRVVASLPGPVALHFASGRVLPRIAEALDTGVKVLSASAEEDLAALKRACAGRATVIGNLNGVQLSRWTAAEAGAAARAALEVGAPGGGFILSDNHGEVPFGVGDEVLHALVDAARGWSRHG